MDAMKLHGIVIVLLLFFGIGLAGCFDLFVDGTTRYQAHPVHVSYEIRYGYIVDCSGSGEYDLHYDCDKPELLTGAVTPPTVLYNQDYETVILANNSMIQWNISGADTMEYTLGLSAQVTAETFFVVDLTGSAAFTLQQIRVLRPDLVAQYTHAQSNETTTFIDPDHPGITSIANTVQSQTNSNNSFILAQSLFTWLKQNTEYQVHQDEGGVQPASVTCTIRTGDCDDLSYLYISLCRSLAIPARFIRGYLIEEENGIAQATSHAWAEVFVGGNVGRQGWIPVECASPSGNIEAQIHQNFGVEDVQHLRLFEDDGSNESLILSLSGISWVEYSPTIEITAQMFAEIDNYTIIDSKQLVITEDNQRSYE
jgi:hypothetical protein